MRPALSLRRTPIDLHSGVGTELNLGPRPARGPERAAREGGQRRWQRPAGCWWRLYTAQGGGAAGLRAFPRSAANLRPGLDKAQDPNPLGWDNNVPPPPSRWSVGGATGDTWGVSWDVPYL